MRREIYLEYGSLTRLTALVFGALIVFAHGRVRVVHRFVVIRAVVAGADLVAALGLLAFAPRALDVIGFVDQSVTVGTVVGVAVDPLRGMKRVPFERGWRPSQTLRVQ